MVFMIPCCITPGDFFSNDVAKIDVFFGDPFRSFCKRSFNKRSFRTQIGPQPRFRRNSLRSCCHLMLHRLRY